MYLALTEEQHFLAEAAAGILSREDTLGAARAALDGAPAPNLWEIAIEAGWPGLVIGEDADGAGLGAKEGMLILEACGEALADARLIGHLSACALLEQADADHEFRASLASGERRATLVDGTLAGVDGSVRSVLDAPGADVLVVVHEARAELFHGDATVEPQPSYDATRSLGVVTFDPAAATPLDIPPGRIRDGRDLQSALLAAESVGAASACLKMARDYALERNAFGRPIGSYQAIKHKLVEMLRRLEAARSLLAYAGRVWTEDRTEFALAANAARVVAGNALDYAAPENIFVHGGIGATWEHDAQLYYRRAEVSRRLAGGADGAADAVAAELLHQR